MIEENIVINANGSQAAAALNAVDRSMSNLTESQGRLKTSFSHKFEHAGVRIFAGQVLHLAGLGPLAQHAMGAIALGMDGVAAAAGLAGGALGPVLFGVGALMVAFKAFQHEAKGSAEETQKVREETDKLAASFKTTLTGIEDYQKELKTLPDDLKALQEATEKAARVTTQKQMGSLQADLISARASKATTQAKIDDLNRLLEREKLAEQLARGSGLGSSVAHKAEADKLTASIRTLNSELITEDQKLKDIESSIKSLALGYQSTADREKAMADAHKKAAEEAKKAGDQQKSIEEKNRAEIERRINLMADAAAKQRAAIGATAEEEKRQLKAISDHASKAAKNFSMMGQAGKQAFDGMGAAVGNAFGKMIVESKSWEEAFSHILDNVMEQFISMVVQMAIKWAAFQALTGGIFGYSGGASGANALLGTAFAGATGADMTVNRPTMFLAGEGFQPERVSITPAGGGGTAAPMAAGGGGSSTTVSVGQIVVQGASDPQATAEAVYSKIVRMVRGRGQIGATGPGIFGA